MLKGSLLNKGLLPEEITSNKNTDSIAWLAMAIHNTEIYSFFRIPAFKQGNWAISSLTFSHGI